MKRAMIPAVATVVVLIALARMPYGYYMLLRLALCVACVYYGWQACPPLAVGHRFALGGLAVLYNPLIPVHLGGKWTWTVVNIATVLYFWFIESRRSSPAPTSGPAG